MYVLVSAWLREEHTLPTHLAVGDVDDEPGEQDDFFLIGSQIIAMKSGCHDVNDDKVTRCGHDKERDVSFLLRLVRERAFLLLPPSCLVVVREEEEPTV